MFNSLLITKTIKFNIFKFFSMVTPYIRNGKTFLILNFSTKFSKLMEGIIFVS